MYRKINVNNFHEYNQFNGGRVTQRIHTACYSIDCRISFRDCFLNDFFGGGDFTMTTFFTGKSDFRKIDLDRYSFQNSIVQTDGK